MVKTQDIKEIMTSENKQLFKRFLGTLKNENKGFITVIIAGIISNIAITATPFIMGIAIDNVIALISERGLTNLHVDAILEVLRLPVSIMVATIFVVGITSFIQEYTMAKISEDVSLSLRESITQKFTKLPMRFFDSHQVGDVMSRSTSDLRKVSNFLVQNVNQLVSSVVQIVLGLVMLFYINTLLTIIVLIVMLLSSKATQWISQKNKIYAEKSQTTFGELSNVIEELYSGNMVVKAFNKQDDAIEKVRQFNSTYTDAFKKSRFIEFSIYPAIRMLNQLAFVISAGIGAVLVIQGSLSIGNIQAFLQYVNQISEPVTTSSYVINAIQSALAAMERYFEIVDAEEELPERNVTEEITQAQGEISFKNVKFGYSSQKLLMNNVNFTAKKNQMVAIVGPTGAGKTTLVNLLMRFYELNDGAITFDGHNITDLSRSHLRKLFGMVLQDAWLFDGTVAENIAYGKHDASREEIEDAAKAAQVDHFIRTLPQGYDTPIRNAGSTISQGQQQLITIARVLLVNPSVVILDEATSSVDTRTELDVQTAMKAMLNNRTSFVIAHRLSTIVNADLILVMKEGDIIEHGTHHSLLANDGFYAQLFNSQFATSN